MKQLQTENCNDSHMKEMHISHSQCSKEYWHKSTLHTLDAHHIGPIIPSA